MNESSSNMVKNVSKISMLFGEDASKYSYANDRMILSSENPSL